MHLIAGATGNRVIVSCARCVLIRENVAADSFFENPEIFRRRTQRQERAESIHGFGLTIVAEAKSSIVNCGAGAGSEDSMRMQRLIR
jgi:hypothetical protein